MTAVTYQYVDLPDASVVTTRALLTAREDITDTVAARAMMCIHGGAGFGKTLAVNTCLREIEPHEDVRKVTFRARPTARAVRYELFTALDLAGEPPCHPSEFDRLLKTALAERPRAFLVDEALPRLRRYAHRILIAVSCSRRSGDRFAALLRWLLIHDPSLRSRSCWFSPSPPLPMRIRSTCPLGTFRWPSRS